ncbi:hypothetical protein [Roseibium sp. ROS1]
MRIRVLWWPLLGLAAIFSFLLILPNAAQAAQRASFQCQPKNKVVGRSGKLVVGDFAISRTLSSNDRRCPGWLLRLDQPIKTRPGQVLYFWFRMNGGPDYLDTVNNTETFRAYFSTIRSDGQIRPEKVINLGSITKWKAEKEAEAFGGHFDWRLRGKRWGLTVPGKYRLRVKQGNHIICFNRSLSRRCSIDFEITR